MTSYTYQRTAVGAANIPLSLQGPIGTSNTPRTIINNFDKTTRGFVNVDYNHSFVAAGQHQVKGGFGFQRSSNDVDVAYPGGYVYIYWNTPFEISPHDPATVYMAGQYFFKSKDRGDTWTMHPNDLTQNFDRFGAANTIMGVGGDKPMASKHDGYGENSVSTQVRESPSRPGVLWVGTDDGNLHVSQDGGTTFTNVFNNIPGVAGMKSAGTGAPHVQVSRIEPSHFDPATAYVALDNHRNDDWKPYLFKTTDYGKTWTNVTANLPVKGNINALREDPVNPALLFVGTEFNLFASLDGARTWKLFSTGLPSVRVDDILIHPRDKDLIVGTHGRSIWIMDDITPLEQMASPTGTGVKLFDPRPAIQWKTDLQATRRATARQFKGENPAPGTALSFWAPSDMGEAKFEVVNEIGRAHV